MAAVAAVAAVAAAALSDDSSSAPVGSSMATSASLYAPTLPSFALPRSPPPSPPRSLCRHLLAEVPKDVLRHAFSFSTLLDLTGVYAASRFLARQVPSYLVGAHAIHTGFEDAQGRQARDPFRGARKVALNMLCGRAGALVSVHVDDLMRGSVDRSDSIPSAQVERLIRRCSRTLTAPRFPAAWSGPSLYGALATCAGLEQLEVRPVHSSRADDAVATLQCLAATCRSIRSLALCGFRAVHPDDDEANHAIPRHLLSWLAPESLTTIVMDLVLSDRFAALGRFVNVTSLTIENFIDDDEAEFPAFEASLLGMTRLSRLTLGLRDFSGFEDNRALRMPPSLTALDLTTLRREDAVHMGFDAPGLLAFASQHHDEAGLALVLIGAPRLQTIRCHDLFTETAQWLRLSLAFRDRGAAANNCLLEFSVEHCNRKPGGDVLLAIAQLTPNLSKLHVPANADPSDVLGVLGSCPELACLATPRDDGMAPAELEDLVDSIGAPDPAVRHDDECKLGRPAPSECRLNNLHVGRCTLAFLAGLAARGLSANVATLSVDALASPDVDPFAVLEAFPALVRCTMQLRRYTSCDVWRTPTRQSGVAVLSIAFACGDFGDAVPLLAAWCPSVRELTLVGNALAPSPLTRLTAHPAEFSKLTALRFCGNPSKGIMDFGGRCVALERVRPLVQVLYCGHMNAPETPKSVCKWGPWVPF